MCMFMNVLQSIYIDVAKILWTLLNFKSIYDDTSSSGAAVVTISLHYCLYSNFSVRGVDTRKFVLILQNPVKHKCVGTKSNVFLPCR